MKKKQLLKAAFLFVLGLALTTSCSKDDGGGDKFAGVPKGEIVPVGERHETLTGFPEAEGRGGLEESSQVWWKAEKSIVDYHCGGESEEIDNSQENVYYAFKNDGMIYYKIGMSGDENSHYSWEWKDNNKNAIIVHGVEFELRELNANNVVYASYQEEEGCYAITWEQFSN